MDVGKERNKRTRKLQEASRCANREEGEEGRDKEMRGGNEIMPRREELRKMRELE